MVVPGYINALAAMKAVRPAQPLSITITSPVTGGKVFYGTSVYLQSGVLDPQQDPYIDGVSVSWTSNVDGPLCQGIVCDSKPLTPGPHTITATMTGPFGGTARASVTVQAVSGGPPSAHILYPADNTTFYASQLINLRGSGSSPNEPSIPPTRLEWSSSAACMLTPKGDNIWVSLPVGQQTITLKAVDPIGLTATTTIHVNVLAGADYPTVRITQPATDFSSYGLGSTIVFQGFGIDPVDGSLPSTSLRWSSDIDGYLGQGNQIAVKLTGGQCAPYYHHITLTGTNKAGKQATFTLTVLVGQIC